MAVRLSRRKIAEFVVDKVQAGATVKEALLPVAAYLVSVRRTRECELIVREVEAVLAENGHVVADVVTAHSMTDQMQQAVRDLVDADDVQIRATIDPAVLGGVLVQLPGKRLDGTIRHKLTLLRAQQL